MKKKYGVTSDVIFTMTVTERCLTDHGTQTRKRTRY
jgi:hypothetical protein